MACACQGGTAAGYRAVATDGTTQDFTATEFGAAQVYLAEHGGGHVVTILAESGPVSAAR